MQKPILLSKVARKHLNSLPKETRSRVKKALYSLNEPEKRKMLDTKKLKGVGGREDLFRLRIGDYRVVFFENANNFKIIQILHRGKGYKWL
jgi:mRNA interferase RelE/StbE